MKLAIADPPYLGRGARWYGEGRGSGYVTTNGRPGRKPDNHPGAAEWDDIERHYRLIDELARDYDGWALAGAADSASRLLEHAPSGSRLAVWIRPNAMPGGSRVINTWEPVIFYVPRERRGRVPGSSVRDALVAPVQPRGFLGSKPIAWTRWVLELLGYDPSLDEVDDIFTGSGAVAAAVDGMLSLAGTKSLSSFPPEETR